MKDKMKGLLVGLTIGTLISGSAAYAAGTQIEVAFRALKYMFDGVEKAPADGGKGFIYEGTTYVPIRFVSESLGKPVEWDEASQTIWIGDNPTHIVATYQGGQVTKKQLDTFQAITQFFSPSYASVKDSAEYRKSAVQDLIRNRILASRAVEADLKAAQDKATGQINAWKAQDTEKWSQSLQAAKLTESDVEQFLAQNYAMTSLLNSSITEDELKAKFQANVAADKDIYTVASVRHILISINDPQGQPLRTKADALAKAKEIALQLKNGGDWAKLALESSDDPGSKDQGGLYKDAEVSAWVPAFKKAAVELPIGQISEPVETSFGYHVMKVEARTVKTWEQVKPALMLQLAKAKLQTFVEQELPGLIIKLDIR
jgi:foldase protein PrsA